MVDVTIVNIRNRQISVSREESIALSDAVFTTARLVNYGNSAAL